MSERSSSIRSAFTAAAVFRAMAVIGMVVAGVFIVVTGWEALTGDSLPEPVPVSLDAADYAGALPENVRIDTLDARLTAEVGPGWRIIWGLVSIAPAALAIVALWIVFRVFGDTNDPFTEANVRRFRSLAWVATCFLAVGAVRGPIEMELQHSLGIEVIDADLGFGGLYAAIIAWALADIWRRGVALRTEQELTI